MGPAIEKDLTGIEVVAPFHTADNIRVTIPYPDANRPLVLKKQKDAVYADKRYFDLIKYDWLAGSPSVSLQQPYQVVLTEKNARLYYPRVNYADILGKPIVFNDTIQATITGVVNLTGSENVTMSIHQTRSSSGLYPATAVHTQ
jgi:hypothetical protein